jgi:PAS domain S-box-containing protein
MALSRNLKPAAPGAPPPSGRGQAWLLPLLLVLLLATAGQASQAPAAAGERPGAALIAAIPTDFPPTYFRDPRSGLPVGLAVEVMDAVALRAGLRVEYRFARPWQEIEEMVLSGQADLIPLRAVNSHNQNRFIFTHKLDVSPINFIVRASNAEATAAAPGRKLGAIRNSTAHEILLGAPRDSLVLYDSLQHLLMDLLAGQVDAVLTVTENFQRLAEDVDLGERLRVLDPPVREVARAIALRPGQDELRQRLDQAVAEFHDSPEAREIYRKWLGPRQSWWTAGRVALLLGGGCSLALALFFAWHYRALRRVNRRLADDQLFLQTLLDALPFPVFYKNPDLRYLSCNRAFEDFVGRTRGEILGKTLHDIWPGDIADKYLRADQALISGAEGPVQIYEAPMLDRHGDIRQVVFHKAIFQTAAGQPGGIIGALEDITERDRGEQNLRQMHHRLQKAQSVGRVGSWELDLTARTMWASDEAFRLYGLAITPGNSLPLLEAQTVPLVEDRPRLDQALMSLLAGKAPYDLEFAIKRPADGARRVIHSMAELVTDAQGKPLKIVGTMQDITERKQAEQERLINAERLDALVRLNQLRDATLDRLAAFALEEGVRLTGSEIGYVAFANEDETVLTMHAWSESAMRVCEVQDKPIIYQVRDTGLWGDPLRQRRPIITNDYQAASPAKKGTPAGHVPVRRHLGVPIFDGGRVVILAGVGNKAAGYDEVDVRQLTLLMEGMWSIVQRQRAGEDRLQLEAQLRQAQKMEAIGTLAGGIAHDFNNILGVIMGFAELAQERTAEGQGNAKELEHVLAATERARRLVRQILTFGRKVDADQRPLDLNLAVIHVLDILRSTLPRMIAIETALAEDLDMVNADPVQMDQVLINLATNSADAMPEGGRLVFETKNVVLDVDYVRLHPELSPGAYVLLMVSDTGCGMDARTMEQIFNPFFTTKDVGKGTGLGLSMVYGIVTGHGGGIHCHSEPGLGTTFKIYLPARREGAQAPAQEAPAQTQVAGGQERILLVDDEAALRELGAETLAEMGYEVLKAGSGEEALETYRARGGELDLVVLDLGMPGMGGQRCLEAILALNPQARVLIASGYTAAGQVEASLQAGAAGFVAKPYRRLDLLMTVRKVLDR